MYFTDMDDYYDDASDLLVPPHNEIIPGDSSLVSIQTNKNDLIENGMHLFIATINGDNSCSCPPRESWWKK